MEKLKPKLFSVMKSYTKEQFVKDVIAGIIVAIIALPLSIALALASGVTPEKGIYTAITAGFVISFLGGSRVQIAGPTAAFATIVAGIVAKNGMDGLIIATLLAGVILILMGFFTTWQSDQVYPLYDHHRFYFRYCCDDLYRTDQGLPGTDHCQRRAADRDHGQIKSGISVYIHHQSAGPSGGCDQSADPDRMAVSAGLLQEDSPFTDCSTGGKCHGSTA